MNSPRLIAVCGYSAGNGEGLHEICARRLRRAEREAREDDVVLLTGWARGRSAASEAELMARSWTAPCRRLLVDSTARSTLANVLAAASAARSVGAGEVVLVTSSWHAARASALLRVALRGSGSKVEVAVSPGKPSVRARLREVACWPLVPLVAAAWRAQLLTGWSGWSGWTGWSLLEADGAASAEGVDAPAAAPPSGT